MWPFKKKPVKFCVDCKYCRTGFADIKMCDRPDFGNITNYFVTGNAIPKPRGVFCSTERCVSVADYCGPEAKYFEPKETTDAHV